MRPGHVVLVVTASIVIVLGPAVRVTAKHWNSDHHRRGLVAEQQFELLCHGTSSGGGTSGRPYPRGRAAARGIHAVHYRNNVQAIEEIEKLITTP